MAAAAAAALLFDELFAIDVAVVVVVSALLPTDDEVEAILEFTYVVAFVELLPTANDVFVPVAPEFAEEVLSLIWYFGFLARSSSKLRSSGGCIIFEVTPLAFVITGGFGGSGALLLPAVLELGLFVVGGALIVALLQKSM